MSEFPDAFRRSLVLTESTGDGRSGRNSGNDATLCNILQWKKRRGGSQQKWGRKWDSRVREGGKFKTPSPPPPMIGALFPCERCNHQALRAIAPTGIILETYGVFMLYN